MKTSIILLLQICSLICSVANASSISQPPLKGAPTTPCTQRVQQSSANIQVQIQQLIRNLGQPGPLTLGEADQAVVNEEAYQGAKLILSAVKKIDKKITLTNSSEISAIQGLCVNDLNVEATVL